MTIVGLIDEGRIGQGLLVDAVPAPEQATTGRYLHARLTDSSARYLAE